MRLSLRPTDHPDTITAVRAVAAGATPAREPEARWRAEGGPADQATYPCSCGFVFVARVSTSVDCPHCGSGQAW
jgi:hypothetical protein